ncbi:MAG: hypothetical protein WB677_19520 [Xanthobacteraceae bacterium]
MSFHRTILLACTVVLATVFGSAAFAQCGGCGAVALQPVVAVQPVVLPPVVELQPIVAAAPIAVDY